MRFEDALVDEDGGRPFRAVDHGFTDGAVGRGLSHEIESRVWVDNVSDLPPLPFTYEMWLRPSEIPGDVRRGAMDLDAAFGIFLFPRGDVACKTGAEARVDGVAATDTWMHVACVLEYGRLRTYVNGVERADVDSGYTGSSPTTGLRFGGNSPAGDDFRGTLDEARLFSRILTPAEIAASAARR